MSITAKSLNELTFKACEEILKNGIDIPSRNGPTKEICDTSLFLTNPQNRHLYCEGRTNNLYGTLGEILWLFAGEEIIKPVLEFYVPRAVQYSDDGLTWTNAYGPKIYNNGNLKNVVDSFLQDGKLTRRAVMAIWTPETDSIESLNKKGIDKPKDVSCSNFLWFWIRDNKLNLKLGMRSNDMIFGASNINIFEFTILQELVLRLLQNADPTTFKDVELGTYHHAPISLHLYDATIKQAHNIVASHHVNTTRFEAGKNFPIQLGKLKYEEMRSLFNDIYYSLWNNIMGSETYVRVDEIFKTYQVPRKENQLYGYALLAEAFGDKAQNRLVNFQGIKNYLSEDLWWAVKHNHFTPKDWLS